MIKLFTTVRVLSLAGVDACTLERGTSGRAGDPSEKQRTKNVRSTFSIYRVVSEGNSFEIAYEAMLAQTSPVPFDILL